MGFNALKRSVLSSFELIVSSIAPRNAMVAGLYLSASFFIVAVCSVVMALNNVNHLKGYIHSEYKYNKRVFTRQNALISKIFGKTTLSDYKIGV